MKYLNILDSTIIKTENCMPSNMIKNSSIKQRMDKQYI
jgi:hypothetical protein